MDENDTLINPTAAIRLFAKCLVYFGDEVLTTRRFKTTREAWITSMYLLALSRITGCDWWLTHVKDKSGSPDFNCYTFVKNDVTNSIDKSSSKVEVFEWRETHAEKNFINAIKIIKLDKIVDPQLTLVCYIRRNTVLPSAVKLANELKKINPKVKDIWYLGDVSADARIWRVTKIFPNIDAIDLNYEKILSTKELVSFVQPYRSKSNKLEYEKTGRHTILTPEFEVQTLIKLD